jgi:fatty acid desaturase
LSLFCKLRAIMKEALRDTRVRSMEWRDLTHLSKAEIVKELLLSLPWLVASLWAAQVRLYFLALPASFMFFLVGLRQVHNAYHYALGLSRRGSDWVMFALSPLMLGSMHAVQLNHLEHHQHCLAEEDIEGASARLPAWKAVLVGPLFPVRLHVNAWKKMRGPGRRWMIGELSVTAGVVLLAVSASSAALRYHVLAMAVGQCLTSFFAVWTVHHDCEQPGPFARTMRGLLKNGATYNMFFHVEHHLFPAVPTCHLPKLAARLDQAAPELTQLRVF